MKIRANLKQKILSLIDEKGYIIIKTTEEAIFYINNFFPNTSEETINYLDKKRNRYIIFRRTLKSFDIGYRIAHFTYYTPEGFQTVYIGESTCIDIKDLL